MFKVFNTLPEHYKGFISIDLKDNKKEFILINVLSIIAVIPFLVGLGYMEASFSFGLVGLMVFFLLFILNIIVHELIHAFFCKLNNKVKVKFQFHGFAASASAPGVYFQKNHYLLIAMAPFIILGIIYLSLVFLLTGEAFYLMYFTLAVHVSGCVGDLYVIARLLGKPKNTLIEDYGVGMRFYKLYEPKL